MNLYEKTKEYLNKHLNKDIYFFITKNNDKIIATCGIQVIQYLPQCNDNGLMGYICPFLLTPFCTTIGLMISAKYQLLSTNYYITKNKLNMEMKEKTVK